MAPFTITAGRWLTECGVVVTLSDSLSSQSLVPYGKRSQGWLTWNHDGTISWLAAEWTEKLRITGPAPEMPAAPEGSKHLDPPEFRVPVQGDVWLHIFNHELTTGPVSPEFDRSPHGRGPRWIVKAEAEAPPMPPGQGTEEYDAQVPLLDKFIGVDWGKGHMSREDVVEAVNAELDTLPGFSEKDRRIYYQNIVYSVCGLIDDATGGHVSRGTGVVCGTVDEPSTEVTDRLTTLFGELNRPVGGPKWEIPDEPNSNTELPEFLRNPYPYSSHEQKREHEAWMRERDAEDCDTEVLSDYSPRRGMNPELSAWYDSRAPVLGDVISNVSQRDSVKDALGLCTVVDVVAWSN